MLKSLSLAAILAAAVMLAPAAAVAQSDYPNKPIRIIVPYPPGGATDITVRAFAPYLQEALGQPIVVEHRPGAGTNLGAEYAARSASDGYTLYAANFASHAANRWLFRKLPFDPVKDFTQIAMMVRTTLFLCPKVGLGAGSVKELIDMAKARPGKLTYGSPGNGSPNHIAAELLKKLAGIDVVHVPYKGAAPLNVALLGGEVDFIFDASVIAHHRAEKVKCIGNSAPMRWPTDPEIPSIAETLKDYDLTSFFGIVGPAGVPEPIAQKLNDAFRKAAARDEVAKALRVTGVVPFPATLADTRAFLTEQDGKWGPLIEAIGAKVD
jgi:tripartite-type tricarboxylate transporter receptor subunit TctC